MKEAIKDAEAIIVIAVVVTFLLVGSIGWAEGMRGGLPRASLAAQYADLTR